MSHRIVSSVVLILGGVLMYSRIRFLDASGIILFITGLVLINLPKQYPDSMDSVYLSKLFDVHLMLGIYIRRFDDGDPLAASWLIELSKNSEPSIRELCCTKGFRYLQKYDNEIMIRLRDMENFDSMPRVREAARQARLRYQEIQSEWDTDPRIR